MTTNLHPQRSVADGGSSHARRETANKVNGLAAVAAEVQRIEDTTSADHRAKEW